MALGESNMSHFEALTLKFSFRILIIFSHVSVIPKNKIQIMAGKHRLGKNWRSEQRECLLILS